MLTYLQNNWSLSSQKFKIIFWKDFNRYIKYYRYSDYQYRSYRSIFRLIQNRGAIRTGWYSMVFETLIETKRSIFTTIKILSVWIGSVITRNIWCESFLKGMKGDEIWRGRSKSFRNNFGFGFLRNEVFLLFPLVFLQPLVFAFLLNLSPHPSILWILHSPNLHSYSFLEISIFNGSYFCWRNFML